MTWSPPFLLVTYVSEIRMRSRRGCEEVRTVVCNFADSFLLKLREVAWAYVMNQAFYCRVSSRAVLEICPQLRDGQVVSGKNIYGRDSMRPSIRHQRDVQPHPGRSKLGLHGTVPTNTAA